MALQDCHDLNETLNRIELLRRFGFQPMINFSWWKLHARRRRLRIELTHSLVREDWVAEINHYLKDTCNDRIRVGSDFLALRTGMRTWFPRLGSLVELDLYGRLAMGRIGVEH